MVFLKTMPLVTGKCFFRFTTRRMGSPVLGLELTLNLPPVKTRRQVLLGYVHESRNVCSAPVPSIFTSGVERAARRYREHIGWRSLDGLEPLQAVSYTHLTLPTIYSL